MNYREAAKKLTALQCVELPRRSGGSHRKWLNPATQQITALPDWGSRDLKLGTLRAAVKQLGIEWKLFELIQTAFSSLAVLCFKDAEATARRLMKPCAISKKRLSCAWKSSRSEKLHLGSKKEINCNRIMTNLSRTCEPSNGVFL